MPPGTLLGAWSEVGLFGYFAIDNILETGLTSDSTSDIRSLISDSKSDAGRLLAVAEKLPRACLPATGTYWPVLGKVLLTVGSPRLLRSAFFETPR